MLKYEKKVSDYPTLFRLQHCALDIGQNSLLLIEGKAFNDRATVADGGQDKSRFDDLLGENWPKRKSFLKDKKGIQNRKRIN